MARPEIFYIVHATSSHTKTGNIISFTQFEEGDLLKIEWSLVEDEPILASIDESSAEDNSDG